MRYCNHCKHLTPGEDPAFCQSCGRTYDVRLCPRQHVNPRSAEVCSECGSRELTTPQPKRSFGKAALMLVLKMLASKFTGLLLLVALCVYAIYFALQWLSNPNHLTFLMGIGLQLGLLFWLWTLLPKFLRNGITKVIRRKR